MQRIFIKYFQILSWNSKEKKIQITFSKTIGKDENYFYIAISFFYNDTKFYHKQYIKLIYEICLNNLYLLKDIYETENINNSNLKIIYQNMQKKLMKAGFMLVIQK